MRGLIMEHQLTVGAIARRAAAIAPERPVIARDGRGNIRRGTWRETIARARALAVALEGLGVRRGDRVATLCWNQQEHLDAYFAVPMMGAVLHTLNVRLAPRDLAAMIEAAGSRTIIVDGQLLDLLEAIRAQIDLPQVIVAGAGERDGAVRYDELLGAADPGAFSEPEIDERDACVLCFTTGTTGSPKGVLYSHRAIALQALTTMTADYGGVCEADTILVLVPMFHGNAWNHPYAGALAGAALVLPHADLRPDTVLRTIARERVTMTGGVPTVWQGVLERLDEVPSRYDVSSLRVVRIGGSKLPLTLRRGLEERHGVPVLGGFGMTELGPIGGLLSVPVAGGDLTAEQRSRARVRTGRPVPFLEVRVRAESGIAPSDGTTTGELEYRGPSVASGYWGGAGDGAFTEDGWLRSGDVGVVDEHGLVEIQDRKKDLIKSGGEWISSLALEEALVSHPAVADAAVIRVPDARWQERPLAVIVLEPGHPTTADDLRDHLRPLVPRWWLPDRFEFVPALPRTSVGKVRKQELRARFAEPGGGDA